MRSPTAGRSRRVRSPWTRTLFQIDRLTDTCRSGVAVLATSPAALTAAERDGKLACVLGIEGGHALEGRVERVGELARRGVAFLGLTHLVPNELGGSSFPFRGRLGLTALGARVLEAMASHGLAVDVAHASPRLLAALLAQEQARIFCSHTGVAALGPRWRNLDDAALRRIADRGGVVGIIFGTPYLGEPAARGGGGPPRTRSPRRGRGGGVPRERLRRARARCRSGCAT